MLRPPGSWERLADWVRNNPDRLTRLKDYLGELEEEDDLGPDTPSRD